MFRHCERECFGKRGTLWSWCRKPKCSSGVNIEKIPAIVALSQPCNKLPIVAATATSIAGFIPIKAMNWNPDVLIIKRKKKQ